MPTPPAPKLAALYAADAVDFYGRAFGAREVGPRFASPRGQIVAELELEGHRFFVVDENVRAQNLSPETLRGTTVRLNLIVDDPDAVARRAVDAGASVLFPVGASPMGCDRARFGSVFRAHPASDAPMVAIVAALTLIDAAIGRRRRIVAAKVE